MENLVEKNTPLIFAHSFKGAISSAGSEHLPYKQGVTSSNLVSPTPFFSHLFLDFINNIRAISSAGSEHLPYKQGVTSSNLVSPTFSLFFNFVALSGGVFLFFKQKSFFNKKNRIFALLFAESLFN